VKSVLGGVVACFVCAACSGQGADDFADSRRQAIHGGAPADDPSTVELVTRRAGCDQPSTEVRCSAVLISGRILLTAAHCAEGLVRGALEARFANPLVPTQARYRGVAGSLVHPDYRRANDEHDLALLWLDSPAPADAIPAVIGTVDAQQLQGQNLVVVGFGEVDANTPRGPTARAGSVTIDQVDQFTFRYLPSPSMTCRGDSGGPVYLNSAAGRELVGVTVSGDPACEEFGVAVRVDKHLSDFILPALSVDVPIPGVEVASLCSESCSSDADCPFDFSCRTDSSPEPRCELRDHSVARFGEDCRRDGDCASGVCAALDDECRCAEACGFGKAPEVAHSGAVSGRGGCTMAAPSKRDFGERLPLVLGALLGAVRLRSKSSRIGCPHANGQPLR